MENINSIRGNTASSEYPGSANSTPYSGGPAFRLYSNKGSGNGQSNVAIQSNTDGNTSNVITQSGGGNQSNIVKQTNDNGTQTTVVQQTGDPGEQSNFVVQSNDDTVITQPANESLESAEQYIPVSDESIEAARAPDFSFSSDTPLTSTSPSTQSPQMQILMLLLQLIMMMMQFRMGNSANAG